MKHMNVLLNIVIAFAFLFAAQRIINLFWTWTGDESKPIFALWFFGGIFAFPLAAREWYLWIDLRLLSLIIGIFTSVGVFVAGFIAVIRTPSSGSGEA
jgi:hypothetical protein